MVGIALIQIVCRAGLVLLSMGVPPGAWAADYVVENDGIAQPLTAAPGDVARGEKVLVDRELGNCLACHGAAVDAEFFGTTGPTLLGVGARLTTAQLRLRVVDPKRINPATMMPAYFRATGLQRVLPALVGKTILSAQQVEDVVAFLATQKQVP